jgi:hypothetical protein
MEPEEKAVATQRLGKHVPAAKTTQAIIEELLEAVLSMRPVSYQILSMYWKESRLLVLPRTL